MAIPGPKTPTDVRLQALIDAIIRLTARIDDLCCGQEKANATADATLAEIKRGNRAAKARANGTPEPKP